ncbi:hypothetical protein L9F63_014982 [Diploptera punctata]|uniref:DNA primase large subunit n=1 Tax=Diploptera punctata TaxID=6984 RepID=A0AAD8A8X4_DIPPU|nr:hypothetical protein L9F63_014982 [Diploptera punctata]
MEYSMRKRLIAEIQPILTGSLVELYPCDLQLYRLPPTSTITLSEFEELAQERLMLLRMVENVNMLGSTKTYDEWKNAFIAELKKAGLKGYSKLMIGTGCGRSESDLQLRKRDHVSHFILRIAYCRSEDLRRWFIGKELELFKVRFQSLNAEGLKCFMKTNNLKYEPISKEEKKELRDQLYESSASISSSIENYEFYRVPFIEVQDLVRSRRVYISGGYAYVPSTDLISILSSVFRTNLAHGMALTVNKLPYLEGDERIFNLLKDLHHSYTGDEYVKKNNAGSVHLEDIDTLSRHSFAPCMRQLHEHLRATHHMRYGGRMQYGLFLKGIGVSLEDSMKFWREEFTKMMDIDKFEKGYSYNIRHSYGQEGKRADYSPYNCIKIIMSNVGPEDKHGCPFKNYDVLNLKQKLLNWNIPISGINEVIEYVNQGHYQLACGKFFQLSHGVKTELGINHPNQYFLESQEILGGKHKTEHNNAKEVANGTTKDAPKNSSVEADAWNEDMNLEGFDMDI